MVAGGETNELESTLRTVKKISSLQPNARFFYFRIDHVVASENRYFIVGRGKIRASTDVAVASAARAKESQCRSLGGAGSWVIPP